MVQSSYSKDFQRLCILFSLLKRILFSLNYSSIPLFPWHRQAFQVVSYRTAAVMSWRDGTAVADSWRLLQIFEIKLSVMHEMRCNLVFALLCLQWRNALVLVALFGVHRAAQIMR